MEKGPMNNSNENGMIGLGTRALMKKAALHQVAKDGIRIVGQAIFEIRRKRKMVEKVRNKKKERATRKVKTYDEQHQKGDALYPD